MKNQISIFDGGAFSDGVNNNSQRVTKRIRRFNHEQFGEVTTITDENGKVWFKATDVASALGYSDPQKAVRVHCKGVAEMSTPTKNRYSQTVMQMAKFIDESNIYRLVMRSKQESKFQLSLKQSVSVNYFRHPHPITPAEKHTELTKHQKGRPTAKWKAESRLKRGWMRG